jgi:hypothetical protein
LVTDSQAADRGDPARRRRLILLGASNLTRGFSVVLETARRVWGTPVEILGAMGRGRSYGQSTTLLGRGLPGILKCGLWPAIDRQGPAPTAALLTDIGNDILYEVPVERLVGWVAECFQRLASCGAMTIVTQLPVENLKNLSPRRFLFYRRLFVPNCRLDQAEITARVLEVNERVVRMARERGLSIVAQQPHWYAMDPIHIQLSAWGTAWRTILAPWNVERARGQESARASLLRAARCALFFPENAAYFGVARRVRQPCARLRDGTTVALY